MTVSGAAAREEEAKELDILDLNATPTPTPVLFEQQDSDEFR